MIVLHYLTRRENGHAGTCRYCGAEYVEGAPVTRDGEQWGAAFTHLRVTYNAPPPGHLRCTGIMPNEDRMVEAPARARGLCPRNPRRVLEALVPGSDLVVREELTVATEPPKQRRGARVVGPDVQVDVVRGGEPYRSYLLGGGEPLLAVVVVAAADADAGPDDLYAAASVLLLSNRVRRIR